MSKGLSTEAKQAIVSDYRTNEKDTGSPEVQIAILTRRIEYLTKHAQRNAKDHHTRLGRRCRTCRKSRGDTRRARQRPQHPPTPYATRA